MSIPVFLSTLFNRLKLAVRRYEGIAMPLRTTSSTELGRREQGNRKQNYHQPPGHRDGDGSATIPTAITISPFTITENVGVDTQLYASVLSATGPLLGVQPDAWLTSDPAVASVNGTGVVHGVAAGTASITAICSTLNGTVTSNACTVTVVATQDTTPASIVISPSTLSLNAGDTSSLSAVVKNAAGDVLVGVAPSGWSSSDGTKATVSASGVVTAVAQGSANITATLNAVTSNACAVTVSAAGDFSGPAELPRRVPDTNWTTPTIDGLTITPADSAALQAAMTTLATADPTKTHAVILAAGVNYVGNFILPNRGAGTGWVYVFTQPLADGTFPLAHTAYTRGGTETQGQRAGYQHSKLVTGGSCTFPQVQTDNYLPAFSLATGAHHYWLAGLEIGRTSTNTAILESALINTGGPQDTYTSVLADVPHHINITHCLVHGDLGKDTRRAIYANGSYIGIADCSFWHIREAGADSQCVSYWNSPGAISVLNCFGESGGENILGGGAGPVMDTYPDDFMKDITVQWCHQTKNPTVSGTVRKNLDEHKDGGRKLVRLCLFEHNIPEGQDGTTVLYQSLNDSNLSPPHKDISDITFDRVKIIGGGPLFGLVGRVGYGVKPDGSDIVWPLQPTRRVHITNVYAQDVCGTLAEALGADGWLFQIYNGVEDLLIDHVTGEAAGRGIIMNRALINGVDTPGVTNFEMRDCLLGKGAYELIMDGDGKVGEGNATLANDAGGTVNLHNNVFYSPGDLVPSSLYPAGNFYVAASAVGFAARVTQNPGALSAGSPYHNAATDSGDIGADLTAINAMETAVRETVLPWS